MAYFPDVNKVKYEGPDSKNPLSFKFYNADEKVLGKKMRDHLRFSMAYWHTLRGTGSDPFGRAVPSDRGMMAAIRSPMPRSGSSRV